MNDQILSELKGHISTMLTRHQDLAREARERQIEADVIASETVQLESLLTKWDSQPVTLSFPQIAQELPVPVVLLNADGTISSVNNAARLLPGLGEGSPDVPGWLQDELLMFLASGKTERSCELTAAQDGRELTVAATFRRLGSTHPAAAIALMHDISRYKALEQALRVSEERYRILVENQSDLVVKTDANGIIQFVSPSFSTTIGIPETELSNCPLLPLIAGDRQAVLLDKLHKLDCTDSACYEEFSIETQHGLRQFGWSIKGVVNSEGGLTGCLFSGRDITDQNQADQNIKRLAYYDALTGLPNRALLHDRLLHAISQTRRNNKQAAILFIDLDRFKTINDTLGHLGGDELLRQVAQRLKDNVRDADTVARQGGDEFVVVLNTIEHGAHAATVAAKIVAALSHPFQVFGQSLYTGASIGIAMFPDDGQDVATLLKHADMAMYLAKESGRGRYKFFSQELNQRMRERLVMESALRQAIEQNELFLLYQPQFNIKTHRLIGMEAFVRWKHPELGVLMPTRFIPLAEETGLIFSLGEWVLKTACCQAAGWQIPGQAPVPVAVNLSTRQFRHPDLPQLVERALLVSKLPPSCLELEFTENTLLDHAEESAVTLQELKKQGVQLTIDDFGTGYSSFSYLKRFPLDRIKIDCSFIQASSHSSDDAAIAEAIISVGQRLNLSVVAEGVEQPDQRDFLYARGCDAMQGNYFSRPLSAEELLHSGWLHPGMVEVTP